MSFRDIPDKERLTILVPADVDRELRDKAHAEGRSISELASDCLARGLGKTPSWSPKGRAVATAPA